MGRGRGGWGKKGRGGGKAAADNAQGEPASKRQRVDQRDYSGYITEDQKNNQAFEEYYTKNDIVPAGEWESFLEALRRPLPVTFRINGSGRFADHLRDKLQSDFFSHFGDIKFEVDGEPVEPPRPLPWYPNNYAWQMNFSRGQLRKIELLGAIHEFMKKANDNGSISRQEAVSMVPPLFLDVQPSHRVLDMCAAPGSKTFQLLEALHASQPASNMEGANPVDVAMGTPSGYVVANDADLKRCSLLTHQVKRVCSPCLMVTNHSAEQYPQLKKDGQFLRFHRVLCDVPCSGDGTMRKSPDIWRKWTVNNGNGLHLHQLRIAMQGVKLLEVGGRLVYSTCTFNPIEDEAVVAEVLLRCGGAMELVDPAGMLPLLKRMEGKHTWHVRDKSIWLSSYEEARARCIAIEPSLFPSPEKAQLPLHRCMRFLPHHQDTGGFFVAVLQKVSELPPNVEAPRSMAKGGKGAQAAGAENNGDQAAIDAACMDGTLDRGDSYSRGDAGGESAAAPPASEAGAAPAAASAGAGAGASGEGADVQGAKGAAAGPAVASAGAGASGEGADVQGATAASVAGDGASSAQAEAGGAGSEGGAGNAAAGAGDGAAQAAADAGNAAADAGIAAASAGGAAANAGTAAADNGTAGAADNGTAAAETGNAAADAGAASAGAGGAAVNAGTADPADNDTAAADTSNAAADAGAASAGAGDEGNAAASAAAGAVPEARGAEEKGAAGPSAGEPSWIRGQGGRNRTSGGKHAGIDPIVPVEAPEILQSLCDFYGISRDNPLLLHLLSRNLEKGRPKRLNVVSTSVMDLLKADVKEQLKIIATGLKVFDRQELKDASSTCAYRIAQEGVSFLLPHISRQRVHLGLEDFLGLLHDRYISIIPPPPSNPHTDLPETAPQGGEAGTAEVAASEQDKGDSTEGEGGRGQPGKAETEAETEAAQGGTEEDKTEHRTHITHTQAETEAAQGGTEEEKTQAARRLEPTPWNDGTMKGRNQQRKEETKDTALLAALNACMPGCVIAELKPEDAARLGLASGQDQGASGALAVNAPLVLSAWKGKATLAIMADKAETTQMVDKIEAARSRMEGKSQT